jgi:hypothetical protein
VVQQHWPRRGNWSADDRDLDLAVFEDGQIVGLQTLAARDYAIVGKASTFSWLGLRHRAGGIGTEMRAAVLHLAFAGIDAAEATSGAFDDNTSSLTRLQENSATNSMASNATPSAVAPPRPAVCVCLASSGRRISASLSRSPGLRVAGHCSAWKTTGGTSSQLPQRCVPFASDALSHPAQPSDRHI